MRHRLLFVAIALSLGAGSALAHPDKDWDKGGERAQKEHEKHEREEAKREKKEAKRERKEEKRAMKEARHRQKDAHDRDSYFHRHGYARISIPKGHYPPPGMCRAWFPDRPPGHQPPPRRCGAPIPHGAWLIEHPRDAGGHVHVTAYDWSREALPPPPPRVVYREAQPLPAPLPPVLGVGEFNIADGVLVRVIVR